jgi:hypothetical protein
MMQGVHVDIAGVGLDDRGREIFPVQHRTERQRLAWRAGRYAGVERAHLVEESREPAALVLTRDPQGAARVHQRRLREVPRPLLQEITAGEGKSADAGMAVGGGVERRRSSGRMVAGLIFRLEHDHLASAGKTVGEGRAGDAAAYDHDICDGHRNPCGYGFAVP